MTLVILGMCTDGGFFDCQVVVTIYLQIILTMVIKLARFASLNYIYSRKTEIVALQVGSNTLWLL